MRTKRKHPQYGLERVYVRAAGKEYMCILREVRMNVKNFIEKVFFHEYVPGQPNYLTVPLHFSRIEDNKYYHEGYEYDMPINFVSIVCYNYEYPTMFYIDVSYVNPDRPYTLGDLANTFPPGVLLCSNEDHTKEVFYVRQPESGLLSGGSSMSEIMENVNFGKVEKEKKGGAPAGGAATPAATPAAPAKKAK
jgi:hypothetical protein